MELLDILDENMNIIGVEDRKIIHQKGFWHIHVGVWIMNKKGEILLQKRASTKKRNPDKWSRTGGHVDSGETPIIGIQREVEEEIGVRILENKFELINIDKVKFDEYNNHFVYNYFVYVNYELENYKIQEEEVSDLQYFSIEKIEELKRNNDENYTFTKWDNFAEIINILKHKRDKIRQEK